MRIRGRVWFYMLVLGIGVWLIHLLFSYPTTELHVVARVIINVIRVAVFLVGAFFGIILIVSVGEYIKNNFVEIWSNIENWCDKYLTIGKDKTI